MLVFRKILRTYLIDDSIGIVAKCHLHILSELVNFYPPWYQRELKLTDLLKFA